MGSTDGRLVGGRVGSTDGRIDGFVVGSIDGRLVGGLVGSGFVCAILTNKLPMRIIFKIDENNFERIILRINMRAHYLP